MVVGEQQAAIPPHLLRQFGLDKDWQKKASPELIKRMIETAQKYRYQLSSAHARRDPQASTETGRNRPLRDPRPG
ncbi:MAG TPA: hypothetical protein GXX28_05160 [Firmicutes bacterium]|nr:hypothetical protein [Bacillota bacterium]